MFYFFKVKVEYNVYINLTVDVVLYRVKHTSWWWAEPTYWFEQDMAAAMQCMFNGTYTHMDCVYAAVLHGLHGRKWSHIYNADPKCLHCLIFKHRQLILYIYACIIRWYMRNTFIWAGLAGQRFRWIVAAGLLDCVTRSRTQNGFRQWSRC